MISENFRQFNNSKKKKISYYFRQFNNSKTISENFRQFDNNNNTNEANFFLRVSLLTTYPQSPLNFSIFFPFLEYSIIFSKSFLSFFHDSLNICGVYVG